MSAHDPGTGHDAHEWIDAIARRVHGLTLVVMRPLPDHSARLMEALGIRVVVDADARRLKELRR